MSRGNELGRKGVSIIDCVSEEDVACIGEVMAGKAKKQRCYMFACFFFFFFLVSSPGEAGFVEWRDNASRSQSITACKARWCRKRDRVAGEVS